MVMVRSEKDCWFARYILVGVETIFEFSASSTASASRVPARAVIVRI